MASHPITSWKVEGENMEAVTDFIFLVSKITVDRDCSHEIKGCFFLRRKAMTNLYSLLPRVCQIMRHGFLCYRNKQAFFFFIDKKVLIVMVPILINKYVLEHSYNDLKFRVQNCSYFSSNLRV